MQVTYASDWIASNTCCYSRLTAFFSFEVTYLRLPLPDETDDTQRVVTTVLELAGQDQSGLLADVTHLLTTNGCDVRSAAVSQCQNIRAIFVSVHTDTGLRGMSPDAWWFKLAGLDI